MTKSQKTEGAETKAHKQFSKLLKFIGVGFTATIVDYATYQLSLNLLFSGNLTLAAILSGIVATAAAYIMHNNITWQERDPGKYGVLKFFIWNAIAIFGLRPPLTWAFSQFTWLYDFANWLLGWLFSYDFIKSTGVYVLMTIVIMALNYTVYEKLVFGAAPSKKG